jgi:hypothetical protein
MAYFRVLSSWIISIRISQFPNRDSNLDCDPLQQPNWIGMYVIHQTSVFSLWALQERASWLIMFFLHRVYEVPAFWWDLLRITFHWPLSQTRVSFTSFLQPMITDARTCKMEAKWVLERVGGLGVTNQYLSWTPFDRYLLSEMQQIIQRHLCNGAQWVCN